MIVKYNFKAKICNKKKKNFEVKVFLRLNRRRGVHLLVFAIVLFYGDSTFRYYVIHSSR